MRASASEVDGAAHGLLPGDPHDRRLLANVHPPDWVNPTPGGRYNLVVVGGGTAGLVTSAIAAALGARVALVERRLLGGDCLNAGCVPSKALVAAARGWDAARQAAERFGGPAVAGDGDFGMVMERMRRIRAEISGHDGAARFRDLGVDVFLGQGAFSGGDTVEVEGRTLRFRRAVIATGSRAAVPPIPGLADAGYRTNETLFSLTELPRRLVVIGGGPIGCEMAQSFARFGSEVTLLESMDSILPRDDPEAAAMVQRALVADGVRVRCAVRVTGVAVRGGSRVVTYESRGVFVNVEVDEVLVSAGRLPNVDGLGLTHACVSFHESTGVVTDARMRTTNRSVYAIGDVASASGEIPRFAFTHAADAQARMVVRNALFRGRGRIGDLVIPWCTYTSPELAHVGITAEEAARRGNEIDTLTVPLGETDRARLDGAGEGMLRVHLKAGSDTILGATLVAEHAGELISQITQAMTWGMGLARIGETIFPYPTRAEVLRRAADAWRRRKLTGRARWGLGHYFRMLR
jgi:pyruvate/2-oxoglutarate dehydrogenase complex dihydrolipoamide dehydrogenase (E3) component